MPFFSFFDIFSRFFSSNKSPMRDDYHFTHTLGAEMGSAKLEDIDEVMSEEKVFF